VVKQAVEAQDWTSSVSSLDAFYKQFQKGSHLSIRTGSSVRLFVRTLVQLAAETDSFSQEQGFKKQMSTTQAKGFNSLTQRLKKHLRTIDPAEIVAAETAIKSGAGSESDSEQSSNDVIGRETSSVDTGEKSIQDIMDMPKEDVTFDMIDAKVTEIALSRGKKGVDRTRAVQQLSYVLSLSKCAAQEVEILLHIISAQFDLTGSMSTFMPVPVWRSCLSNVLSIMKLLELNRHISLVEEEELVVRPTNDEIMAGAAVQIRGSLCAFAERLDDEYTKSLQCLDAHTKEYVSRLQDEGGLLILIQQVMKFYEEKSQFKAVSNLSLRLLERIHCKTNESYEALKKYSLSRAMASPSANNEQSTPYDDKDNGINIYATSFQLNTLMVFERIEMLAAFIYKFGDERAKARALLCQIFSEALRGGLEVAKELLLMSHLQEIVQHMDISTQILFNRTIAQLGLCAFELGRFDEAATYLSDLFAGGRVRELLAQGIAPARFNERSAEQEKLERRRQTPQHLHINLELLESVFLVCAMLLEISDLVRFPKFRSAACNFTRIVEHHSRQLFMGPPDGVRDTVISAAKLLLSGDYEGASGVVLSLPVWNSLLEKKDEVLSLMDERLKIEATRLYLHQFAEQYTAASTNVLAQMVSTTEPKVCSVVNSVIANEEIPAMLNNASHLLLWKQRQSQLQNASSTYSEKVLVLLDASERALEQHIGGDNSTCREEDEPRRRHSSKGEPEEYESRRSRTDDHGRRYLPIELERGSKTPQLDSYGNFFRRKALRGGKRVHK